MGNDIVGFIVHQALLVPYFAWQYTHAKHHRRTNHLTDGESHVPSTGTENGLGPNNERLSLYAVLHESIGDEAFAAFQVWSHLAIGWPLYLMGLASTGKRDHKGQPLDGRVADHFRTDSPMFPAKVSFKIAMSSIATIAQIVGLMYLSLPSQFGFMPVFLWYWNPYFFVNAWLVLYTWLQHNDPSVPQYGDGEWTWVRGIEYHRSAIRYLRLLPSRDRIDSCRSSFVPRDATLQCIRGNACHQSIFGTKRIVQL